MRCDNGYKMDNKVDLSLPHSNYDKDNDSQFFPVIFWWTGRLHSSIHGPKGLHSLNCPNSVCLTTSDRQFFNDERTRVFMFYGTDIEFSDLPLPRKANHEWALFHEESPMNNYVLSHGPFIKLFNHTATFKRESDLPLTSQHIPSLEYMTERSPLPISLKNDYRNKGLAPVLYIQSHCDVASDRDRYVQKLMKYIKVDSYGKCSNNIAVPKPLEDPVESMHSDDFLTFISRYKFHISFENAICKDYITEKLFRTVHVGSVPIYKGSSAAHEFMPDSKSLIYIDDFESPELLAQYIEHLDKNDSEYMQYLKYKTVGVTNEFLTSHINERSWSTSGVIPDPVFFTDKPDMFNAFECLVCDDINNRVNHEQKRDGDQNQSPLLNKIADRSHMSCPQPYTSIGYPDDYSSSDR